MAAGALTIARSGRPRAVARAELVEVRIIDPAPLAFANQDISVQSHGDDVEFVVALHRQDGAFFTVPQSEPSRAFRFDGGNLLRTHAREASAWECSSATFTNWSAAQGERIRWGSVTRPRVGDFEVAAGGSGDAGSIALSRTMSTRSRNRTFSRSPSSFSVTACSFCAICFRGID